MLSCCNKQNQRHRESRDPNHRPDLAKYSSGRMFSSKGPRWAPSTCSHDGRRTIGYVVKALNQLSETLYFILENEKKALVDANKKCKKGKPGQSGKPSRNGQGKDGKPGNKEKGKLPNGRKKGMSPVPSVVQNICTFAS